jgi:hypothetical protein
MSTLREDLNMICYCRQWHVAQQYAQYVAVFPLQKRLRERATVLRYVYVESVHSLHSRWSLHCKIKFALFEIQFQKI